MITTGFITAGSAVVAQDLRVSSDGHDLLRGVDLTVGPTEHVAVLDEDGPDAPLALLRVVCGLAVPDAGWIQWGGHDLLRLRDSSRSALRRRDVGIALDGSGLLPELPVLENIALPLLLDGLSHRRAVGRAADLLDTIGLSGRGARKVRELGDAERILVALGRALVTEPSLVVVQDPAPRLDPRDTAGVLDLLRSGCSRIHAALLLGTSSRATADRCERTVRIVDGRARRPHDAYDAREALL